MGNGKILIAGKWAEANETIEVRSPQSGELLSKVFSADTADLDTAISTSESASIRMRSLARFEIARGLTRIADGIEARKAEFAATITAESAKPISLARGEVDRAIATFRWAAGEAERYVGQVVPVDTQPVGRGKSAYTLQIPRGVIYGITPFNFPLNLVAHKVAPALASGNSIIIKPSPRTPLTALMLGEVFLESGLPASALQVLPMDVSHMHAVYDDERIKMISFTGSVDIGWDIKQKAQKKFVTLELGGNASVIVDETADLETSLSRTLTGGFAYSGQVCISVQRVLVHDKHFENWLGEFAKRVSALKVGDPAQDTTEIGVMIDEASATRAESWVTEAIDNGARLVCGGKRNGAMFDATVLTGTDNEMRVVSEEVFAPVVVVEKFGALAEAVDMANQGRFGLQAGVFTRSLDSASYAAENLEYGSVVLNDVPTFRVDNMPYGGVKDSGFGREGVRYAMDEMTEPRLIVTSK
jgi:acyl-CoA reductase-like NAD-dependent aldehyde dehydrogenase